MNRRENAGSRRRAGGLLLAFLAGAGTLGATILIVRRIRPRGRVLSLESVLAQCDEAAAVLDGRIGDGDIALAG